MSEDFIAVVVVTAAFVFFAAALAFADISGSRLRR